MDTNSPPVMPADYALIWIVAERHGGMKWHRTADDAMCDFCARFAADDSVTFIVHRIEVPKAEVDTSSDQAITAWLKDFDSFDF